MKALPARVRKRHLAALAAALAVALGAALGLRARRLRAAELSEPLRRGTIVEAVYGIGTVVANRSFSLRSAVPSTVRELFVKEGDRVARGRPLAALDGIGVFRAPFGGTVTALPVKEGETVFAQSVILDLVDLSDRYVVVSLEQRAAIRARRGQRAALSFENMREKPYDGVVESLYSSGGSFLVRIDAPALPPQVLPGMTADVSIAFGERRDALLAPVAAIQDGTVLVRRGRRRATPVAVRTGVVDGALAEIVSGDVREGERLVLPGRRRP